MSSQSTLHAALMYAERGWRIVPVHNVVNGKCSCKQKAECRTPGKHPRQSGWTNRCSANVETIRRWWKQWPTANIGIVTGTPSGIMVLDFDEKNGGLKTLAGLKHEFPELANTFRVKTGGGGIHLYFQLPAGSVGNAVGVLPGMDIRGDNGMAIAAGSTHESGNRYEVQNDAPTIAVPAAFLPRFHLWTQERHKNNTGTTQERHKQVRCERVAQVEWESLSSIVRQQIDTAIQRSLPTQSGERNCNTFNFTRRLQSIEGIDQTTNPETLRQIVKRFHGEIMATAQKNGFEIRGSFVDTFNDVRYAWNRVHTPIDQVMGCIVEKCLVAVNDNSLPEQVSDCLNALQYADDRDTTALVVLCWYLNQHWQGQGFFLSVRAGESALKQLGTSKSANFQWVSRRLNQLSRDGVILCIKPSKPGQRGTASEYIWTWELPQTIRTKKA